MKLIISMFCVLAAACSSSVLGLPSTPDCQLAPLYIVGNDYGAEFACNATSDKCTFTFATYTSGKPDKVSTRTTKQLCTLLTDTYHRTKSKNAYPDYNLLYHPEKKGETLTIFAEQWHKSNCMDIAWVSDADPKQFKYADPKYFKQTVLENKEHMNPTKGGKRNLVGKEAAPNGKGGNGGNLHAPSDTPSFAPSRTPRRMPSYMPSYMPSHMPSSVPSSAPSSDNEKEIQGRIYKVALTLFSLLISILIIFFWWKLFWSHKKTKEDYILRNIAIPIVRRQKGRARKIVLLCLVILLPFLILAWYVELSGASNLSSLWTWMKETSDRLPLSAFFVALALLLFVAWYLLATKDNDMEFCTFLMKEKVSGCVGLIGVAAAVLTITQV